MKYLMTIVLAALLLAGCSSKTRVESDLGVKGAPDWINEGTQILNDKGGRLFHGVGQAPQMGDRSLQISTADSRARAEVARVLSSFIDVVNRDYASASGSAQEMVAQQSISRQIESLTRTNLSGAEIIGHWRDKKSGIVYAIAELDLDRIKRIVASNQEMNQDFGSFFETHGDNVFDRQMEESK